MLVLHIVVPRFESQPSLPFQPLDNADMRDSNDGSSAWVPAITWDDLDWILGCRCWLLKALGGSEPMEDLSISLSLFACQINKRHKK